MRTLTPAPSELGTQADLSSCTRPVTTLALVTRCSCECPVTILVLYNNEIIIHDFYSILSLFTLLFVTIIASLLLSSSDRAGPCQRWRRCCCCCCCWCRCRWCWPQNPYIPQTRGRPSVNRLTSPCVTHLDVSLATPANHIEAFVGAT